ncbi:MAG: hypothetical protein HKN60_05495, partial [Rhizobiales bacterium]|nr:hypothetical protein [Hyphomicrobiales bacterium]
IYGTGDIVERDYVRAAGLFQRAADLGEVTAKFNLAMLYKHGAGVARDDAAATRLFLAAAEAGDMRSAYQAARALDRGAGIGRDRQEAARQAIAALRGGYGPARVSLAEQPQTWSAEFRRAVQRELHGLGVYDGAIDGIFGRGTRRALTDLSGE